MANTYTENYQHLIFSTKNRLHLITPSFEPQLYEYMGGIAANLKCRLLNGNGMADHVHLLVSLHSTVASATLLQQLKGSSSKWINENKLAPQHFGWQDGAAILSVSAYKIETLNAYIDGQKAHHQNESFADEYRKILTAHGVAFDERYLFG